jgi:hypothetical protein
MGTVSGPQELFVFAVGAEPAVFRASAIADRPAQMLIVAGMANTGRVGTVVSAAPSVRVVDRYGNPVVGTRVTFTRTPRTPLNGVIALTDSTGVAKFEGWTLGSQPGVYVLLASVPSVGSVEFKATATPP